MDNTKLFFVEAVLFDGDNAIRVIVDDESKAEDAIFNAFVDHFGPIEDYGYESRSEWKEDIDFFTVQETRIGKYWVEG